MKKIALLTGTATIVAALSAPAFAQTEYSTGSNVTGVGAVEDRITDIEDVVVDDFDRSNDPDRFGPADRRQGLFGQMSLSYSGSDGDTKNGQDLLVAGRVSYNQGPFAQSVGLAMDYSENDDGDKDSEEVSAIYDAQYYFNDRFYAFALGRISVDGLVESGSELRRDGFLGFGPGYRVINTDQTAWRVQAGVGVRYTQTGDQYIADESDTDTGYIASSRFYHKVNDMVFLTNDTDYLTSDAGDLATNQFGVNFKVSDALVTKISYTTEYEKNEGAQSTTDNTLGFAVVYGF